MSEKLLGTSKSQRDEIIMSYWTLETKADVGICGFSNTLPNLFKELTMGMMSLLTSEEQALELNKLPRYAGQWNVEINSSTTDYESLLLVWLEEVLYRLEVKGNFLVDAQIMIQPEAESLTCQSQVSYVEGDLVKRHLEIKAVTSHDLLVKNLISGEVFNSLDVTIPEMYGPAWVGNVIFDI